MDSLAMEPTAVVLLMLAAVAVGAVLYEPESYFGGWRGLTEAFATERQASSYPLRAQRLMLASFWDLCEYGAFDVAADSEGLWLRYAGPDPRKCCPSLLIPWNRIRLRPTRRGYAGEELEIQADKPRRLIVPNEITALAASRLASTAAR